NGDGVRRVRDVLKVRFRDKSSLVQGVTRNGERGHGGTLDLVVMAIRADDGVEVALEVCTVLVELDVEPEVFLATGIGRITAARSAGNQVAAARNEAGREGQGNINHDIVRLVIPCVVAFGRGVPNDRANVVRRIPCGANGQGHGSHRRADGRVV